MKKIKSNNAIFAGSFDPLTRGHIWIIERSASTFDKLIVVVRDKFESSFFLSSDDRVQNIKNSTQHLKNVDVIFSENEFIVKVAKRLNATTIIRGIRNSSDYVSEQNISNLNQDIDQKIITIFLMPPKALMDINSSFVKSLIGKDGWRPIIKKYVDISTYQFLSLRNLKYRINKDFRSFYNLLQLAEDKIMSSKIEKIINFYSSKDRHYHNFTHIDEMLDLVNILKLNDLEKFIVKMAIYYHDIIYDSSSIENEENSIKLMRKEWANELTVKFHFGKKQYNLKTLLDEVSVFILNTKNNRELSSVKHKHLLKIFIDLDLAILGQEAERVWEYDSQIKKEFSWISSEDELEFSNNRIKLFDKLLESKQIFYSDEFKHLENKTRSNLNLLKQKYYKKNR